MMGPEELEDLKRRQRAGDEAELVKDGGPTGDERSKLKALGFALKNGGKALKFATVRIQHPKTMQLKTSLLSAGKGKAFTEEGLHDMLVMIAGDIEKAYPAHEWELVATGIGSFSFMCRGKKEEATDGNA